MKKKQQAREKELDNDLKNALTFKCGNCGNISNVKTVKEYTEIDTYEEEHPTPWGTELYHAGEIWQLIFCPNCDELNLRHAYIDDRRDPEIIEPKILFPTRNNNPASPLFEFYINQNRLSEIRAIESDKFDLTKLVKLCEELNECYNSEHYLATSMLVRAITDHIPPIFDCKDFSEVANNYAGSKSFKKSMQNLEKSLRNIADGHLHNRIRSKEVLPNKTQINFTNDLDVLLSEVVRLLK